MDVAGEQKSVCGASEKFIVMLFKIYAFFLEQTAKE